MKVAPLGYQEKAEETYWTSFTGGWSYLTSGLSAWSQTASKVLGVVSACLPPTFCAFSWQYAFYASQDAVHEYRKMGRAPIIGHPSEWSMLGASALGAGLTVAYEFRQVGRYIKGLRDFDQAIREVKSADEQEVLYQEKLDFVKTFTKLRIFSLPTLPSPPDIDMSEVGGHFGKLVLDIQLAQIYRDIQESVNQFTFLGKVKRGWSVIKNPGSGYNMRVVKGGLGGIGSFLGANLINYPLAIYWAAKQAKVDKENGDRPTIGGHSFEWFAEMIVTYGIVYEIFSEIATVGEADMLEELFEEKKKTLGSAELARRLDQEKRSQKRMLPEGYLFIRKV